MRAEPVDGFGHALRFLAAKRYCQERREILASLGASGILTLDSTAQELAVALANCYFDIHHKFPTTSFQTNSKDSF